MRWMGRLLLFLAGTTCGMFLVQAGASPQAKPAGLRLNHVGMYVKNLDESINFYTKTLGFRQAFSLNNKEGKPTLVYLQMSRDTFLELAPSDADRPVGFSHAGIWADDLNTTVMSLRAQGIKVDDPRAGATKAPLTNVIDPNGLRLEILDLAPESLQRKAIEAWR